MQELDPIFENAIKESHTIVGKSKVVAEWSFNHLLDPVVTNEGSTVPDHPYYPIDCIADGFRPYTGGIMRAITNEARTSSLLETAVKKNRYYTATRDAVYKYWVSPTPSLNGAPDDIPAGQYPIEDVNVLITYPEACKINKAKVIMNLGAAPVDWSLEIYNVNTSSWMVINDPVIDADTGKYETWWNGSNWIETPSLEEDDFILSDKIRLTINSVSKPNSFVHLVELCIGREIDLTPRVISYEINQSMDEQDFVHPVGIISSSSGQIILDNSDLAISRSLDSNYSGILNGWCNFRTYVQYDLSEFGGSSEYTVPTGFSYTNDWQRTNEYEYEIELFDILKIMQNTKAQARLFENMPIAKIVSGVLDCAGFSNYVFDTKDFGADTIVKYFWTDGTEMVYDVLKRLCESHQAAIFVDETGTIQLLTRAEIANEEDEPVWTFRAEQEGDVLPDIVTLSNKYSLQANEVTINYKKMQAKVDDSDVTETQLKSEVWNSTDTTVLRATPLVRTLYKTGSEPNSSGKDIWIAAANAATWPFKGKVNIDGELIEYDGKGYKVWNFSGATPTSTEKTVKTADEKRKYDLESYRSYMQSQSDNLPSLVNGAISSAAYHNSYTGRLVVAKRDVNNLDVEKTHSILWDYGWMGWNGWTTLLKGHSGKHFDYGSTVPGTNYANLKNIETKPGWTITNHRWTLKNSIVTCDSTADGTNDGKLFLLMRDLGDTEYREFGTRFRFSGGDGDEGCIVLYATNANGYDTVNTPITDPYLADRCYIISFMSTAKTDKRGRSSSVNELVVQSKDGTVVKNIEPIKYASGQGSGRVEILKNRWYDIDIVYRDAYVYDIDNVGFYAGKTAIEIFIDGRYITSWLTTDAIRPTGLIGIGGRNKTKIDFEYFYATNSTDSGRAYYINSIDDYDFGIMELPSGTNLTKRITLPTDGPRETRKCLSLISPSSATISSVKIFSGTKTTGTTQIPLTKAKTIGPIALGAEKRYNILIDDILENATAVEIKYTSTAGISLCYETSEILNEPYFDPPPMLYAENSYYDLQKAGHSSAKKNEILFKAAKPPLTPLRARSYVGRGIEQRRKTFYDDFGPIVREVRDFDVKLDNSPAKGVQIYSSNKKVDVVDITTNPLRGIFTLANISHKDEIVNGTEEVSENDSIDHTLMLYGYILEDKGDQTKIVKDDASIRKYGKIPVDINAEWIFDEEEAEKLAKWITDHWSEPMDTIELDVFANTFIQIGDKVNVKYPNIDIQESWLYIVSDINRSFDEDGLTSRLILRRVR